MLVQVVVLLLYQGVLSLEYTELLPLLLLYWATIPLDRMLLCLLERKTDTLALLWFVERAVSSSSPILYTLRGNAPPSQLLDHIYSNWILSLQSSVDIHSVLPYQF